MLPHSRKYYASYTLQPTEFECLTIHTMVEKGTSGRPGETQATERHPESLLRTALGWPVTLTVVPTQWLPPMQADGPGVP